MSRLFGKRLRRARIQAGLSQVELSDKLGISRAMVSQWERGKFLPSENNSDKLASLFGDFNRSARSIKEDEASEEDVEDEDVEDEDDEYEDDEDDEYEEEEDEEEEDDGSNAFGEWLRDARKRARLSRHQLAQAAGVSRMAIRNIEVGKTQNPQDKTRERLEKALKVKVPENIAEETAEEQTIKGLGALIDFDPYSINDLPKEPGVYVFYDISDRPIYIGQGQDIAKRVKSHAEKFWFKQPIVRYASYVRIADKRLREQVEQVLIKFLKSNAVINRQLVERRR